MHQRISKPQDKIPYNNFWQKTANYLNKAADWCNIGIGIHIVSNWTSQLAYLAAGSLYFITVIADPLIYIFRALARFERIIGRHFFGVKFKEEEFGIHPRQTIGDVLSFALFICAAAIFIAFGAGAAMASFAPTLGWALGILGLSIVVYFDYHHAYHNAKIKWLELRNKYGNENYRTLAAKGEYSYRKYADWLMISLVGMLALALICGSALTFAPPIIIPALLLIAKISGIALIPITIGRITNYYLRKPCTDYHEDADKNEKLNKPSSLAIKEKLNTITNTFEKKPDDLIKLNPPAPSSSSSISPKISHDFLNPSYTNQPSNTALNKNEIEETQFQLKQSN